MKPQEFPCPASPGLKKADLSPASQMASRSVRVGVWMLSCVLVHIGLQSTLLKG